MKKNETSIMAATTRSKTTTKKLSSEALNKLNEILEATNGFEEFEDQMLGWAGGAFDFTHGRGLPVINGPYGTVPFNELITGLSEEQSTGNYLAYGQEVWDSTSFLRRNIGLDDKFTDDNDRGSNALVNAYLGIILESSFKFFNPALFAEIQATADEIRRLAMNQNCTPGLTLKYARELKAKKFRELTLLVLTKLPLLFEEWSDFFKLFPGAKAPETAAPQEEHSDNFFEGINDVV